MPSNSRPGRVQQRLFLRERSTQSCLPRLRESSPQSVSARDGRFNMRSFPAPAIARHGTLTPSAAKPSFRNSCENHGRDQPSVRMGFHPSQSDKWLSDFRNYLHRLPYANSKEGITSKMTGCSAFYDSFVRDSLKLARLVSSWPRVAATRSESPVAGIHQKRIGPAW
jgi:hypothetical protein